MNTVLRATDSADFLGLVPALAGFTPRQSIVLVPFQRSRAHGAMRIDLPRDDVELGDYADTAIGLVSRVSGMDAVAAVVYTDDLPLHTPDGMILPQTVAMEELLAVAVDTGLHIVDALCVMPCGWSSYFDDDPELNPLDEIEQGAEIPGVPDVSGDQDAGAELPVVDLAEKERVGRALRELSEVLAHDGGTHDERENPQALAAALLLDDLPMFFETVIARPDELPPFVTGALLWCLERPPLRDAALLQWATDLPTGIRAFDAQLAFSTTGRAVPDDLGQMFIGQGEAPDAERLLVALDVLRRAAASAPRASRSAPLTLAAWISWALGRATHAQHYLNAVGEIDPGYSLARLLCTLIDAAVLPEWTFRRGRGAE
ncbi:DUF4192 family protein [Microbacterium sp.]|uniref:DUF4192 family protein n=1 Tax=Microbacterium sp. TaxID=51671 RepID=UPI002BAF96DF|nr:DUF4192 family protein [Microbacterium sp.]HWK76264.1 DUF4192 family protein [Microbacterium sp.]